MCPPVCKFFMFSPDVLNLVGDFHELGPNTEPQVRKIEWCLPTRGQKYPILEIKSMDSSTSP